MSLIDTNHHNKDLESFAWALAFVHATMIQVYIKIESKAMITSMCSAPSTDKLSFNFSPVKFEVY